MKMPLIGDLKKFFIKKRKITVFWLTLEIFYLKLISGLLI
jgi:hypothetical protein